MPMTSQLEVGRYHDARLGRGRVTQAGVDFYAARVSPESIQVREFRQNAPALSPAAEHQRVQ